MATWPRCTTASGSPGRRTRILSRGWAGTTRMRCLQPTTYSRSWATRHSWNSTPLSRSQAAARSQQRRRTMPSQTCQAILRITFLKRHKFYTNYVYQFFKPFKTYQTTILHHKIMKNFNAATGLRARSWPSQEQLGQAIATETQVHTHAFTIAKTILHTLMLLHCDNYIMAVA